MSVFQYINQLFAFWFTAQTPLQALFDAVIFIIAMYGFFRLAIFLIRYYLIYRILQKLFKALKGIKFKNSKYKVPPSNKEDEKLRSQKAEKIAVEKMEKEAGQFKQNDFSEADFVLTLPKIIGQGKWQKFVLKDRQNMIVAVAREMQNSRSPHFWQAYIRAQKGMQQQVFKGK